MTKILKVLAIFIVLSLSSSAQIPTSSGFYFDGVDDRVTIPSIPAYNNLFDNDFSIEFWCRLDTAFYEYNVITIGDGISSNRLEIILKPQRVDAYFWQPSGNGIGIGNVLPDSINDGECHHFVLVIKNKRGWWYTDGASYTNSGNSLNFPGLLNPKIIVGQDYINPQNNSFKGLISMVRLWKKALSQAEVLNSIVAPVTPTFGVLLGYWKLDNKYKQKVEDYSTFSNFGAKGSGLTAESSDPSYSMGCQNCIGPSINIQKVTSTTFCAGDSSKLKVIIPANYSCQWYKNGLVIAGQTDSIIYGKTNGVFSAILTDTLGCKIYSDAVVLRIYFGEVGNTIRLGAKPNAPQNHTCWWSGRKDTLQVGFSALYSYQWLNYGVPIPNSTNYRLTVTDTGEYTCQVSVGSCTKVTSKYYFDAFRANINPLSPPVTCLDTMVSLKADHLWTSFPQYVWKVNGTVIANVNSQYLTTSITGNITCTVTDTNFCPLPAVSPSIYVAHNQDPNLIIGVSGFPLNVGPVINNCSGIYGEGLDLVDQYGFTFSSPDLLSVNWYGDYTFFQANQSRIVVDKSGDYGVSYTSVCGSGSDYKLVYFAGTSATRPNINGAISSCFTIPLTVDAPFNFQWPGYQWYWNDSIIPGATSSGYVATKAGNYFCVLNNSCDTIATYSRYANVLFDNYKIFPVNGTAICNGVPKQLQVGGGNSFLWKKNGVVIPGATSSLYTATTTGTYVCLISGNCGSTSDTIVITNGTALVPPVGCITGGDIICPSSSFHQYSVQPVAGATHYSWILPNGAVAKSKLDSNSLSIQFEYYFYGGTLYFLGINDCGTDTLCSIYIHSLKPKAPVLLSGDRYGLCGGIETYRCSTDTLVSSYVWTVPTGATILSGQGTDSLVVQFGTIGSSATLKVYGVATSCSNSPSLNVGLTKYPNNSGPISGSVNVCANQTSLVYSVLPVEGAVSYLWTLPPGAIQTSGGNSDSITITMGASSGLIFLWPQSSCLTGNQVSKQLNVVCREGDESGIENEFQIIASVENGILKFQIDGLSEIGAVKVVNSIGQVLSERDVSSDDVIQMSGLSSGMYFITCHSSGKKQTLKVIVY